MDDVLILYQTTKTQDETGVWRTSETEVEVFCKVHSITRTEFFEAGRNGLNPAYQFTVFQGDYSGEVKCGYRGQNYAIYRTYIIPGTDYIELYAERQGGTNGAAL